MLKEDVFQKKKVYRRGNSVSPPMPKALILTDFIVSCVENKLSVTSYICNVLISSVLISKFLVS